MKATRSWEGEAGVFGSSKLSGQPSCPRPCNSSYCQEPQILRNMVSCYTWLLRCQAAVPDASFIIWLLALMSLKNFAFDTSWFYSFILTHGTVREREEWNPAGQVTKIVLFCHVLHECLVILASKRILEHQPGRCRLPWHLTALWEQRSPLLAHPPQALWWLRCFGHTLGCFAPASKGWNYLFIYYVK